MDIVAQTSQMVEQNVSKFRNELEIYKMKILIAITFFVYSTIAIADEWKKCDVTKSMASNRDVAMELGNKKISFNFLKKIDYFYISMYVDDVNVRNADVIKTGKRQYSDGSYFTGYADKTNTLRIQEFETSTAMIVSISGEIDFTFFVNCK